MKKLEQNYYKHLVPTQSTFNLTVQKNLVTESTKKTQSSTVIQKHVTRETSNKATEIKK